MLLNLAHWMQAARKPQRALPHRFFVSAPRNPPQEIFMIRELNTESFLHNDEVTNHLSASPAQEVRFAQTNK